MKHTIIILVIAIAGGLCLYFFAVNKTKSLDDVTKSLTEELNDKQYKVETLIQINENSDGRAKTKQFLDAELRALKSSENLSMAIKDYHLEKLLNAGESELLAEMKAGIEIMPIRGNYLLSFNVSADSELKAQQISYAILYSYIKTRVELSNKRLNNDKKSLAEKLTKQEVIVEQLRLKLFELSKKLRIPYPKSNNLEIKTPEETTDFRRLREEYEKEAAIEDALKMAKFETDFRADLQQEPLIFHSMPWPPELHETMQISE